MEITDLLYYGDDAQRRLIAGINKLANAVKVTMGPGGRYVILGEDGEQYPRVTKDGVSVANYTKLIDPIENMGAKIMKQTSRKTVDLVGDGTTTATVLTQALVNNVQINASVADFRKGMELGKNTILNFLQQNRITDITKDTLYKIALTSSNHDEEIAKQVSNIVHQVGKEGIVNLEKSEFEKTQVVFEAGYKFDRGIPSSRFMNNENKGNLELKGGGYVLLLDSKLEHFSSIVPIISFAKSKGKFLVVIAKEYSEEVIHNCVENSKRGNFVIPILAPEFGSYMLANLEDLGIYCDGTITTESKLKNKELSSEMRLGTVDSFVSNLQYSILKSDESESRVVTRLQQLKNLLEEAANKRDEEKIKKRISQLSTGFAVIKVGGNTPAEIDEKYDRYEDAVGACRASLENGILPGGGVALYKAALNCAKTHLNDDAKIGYLQVIEACKAPLQQILSNASITGYTVTEDDFRKGIDATDGQEVDMIVSGIIDPYKVTISALTNAISIAVIVLSTGCVMDNNQVNVKM